MPLSVPKLLIVPYGIETRKKHLKRSAKGLLIVPYGIETVWFFT